MKISHLLLTIIIALCCIGCSNSGGEATDTPEKTYDLYADMNPPDDQYEGDPTVIYAEIFNQETFDFNGTLHVLLEYNKDGEGYQTGFDQDLTVTISGNGYHSEEIILTGLLAGNYAIRMTITSNVDSSSDDNLATSNFTVVPPVIIAPVGNN